MHTDIVHKVCYLGKKLNQFWLRGSRVIAIFLPKKSLGKTQFKLRLGTVGL
jgi:hypothetical protein